ncbi:LysR family transcriptional regulator [Nesterenkonia aerolata]|uniref:LysR family transcriptional regulator n=1 Tax=Nesterenkonia aerolata TaxID=3074079 RepID=A0ABU2DRF1_9MICC|nr:LysR family transcriptional regulator [Nesterenkonia sp. LY-0111]MDR8019082.1 LysR family transcriptional regulator [Nesterenkonia sp. LY-0111]
MKTLLPTDLRYFRETALRGSVNRAAAEQRVAPSAVSRQIRKLERGLGVELFVRHGKGVDLTEAGLRLLTHIRRAEIEETALLRDLADGTQADPLLRIACSSAFSTSFVARALTRVRVREPDVRFEVQTVSNEEATRLVSEERVDVAATFSTRPHEGIRVEHSVFIPTRVVLAVGHELADRESLALDDVLDFPYGLLRGQSSQRELLRAAARRSGRELRPVLEADQHDALLEFARTGGGVAFASILAVDEARRYGLSLVELRDPELRLRNAQLQTSPWRQPDRVQMVFVEEMITELGAAIGTPQP